MTRPTLFARSVIPRDPTQLLFLLGSVLLFISMQLRCFPMVPDHLHRVNGFPGSFLGGRLAEAYPSWILFSAKARLPVVLAGAAGLFICFWPGIHPLRRILVFVLVPALAGTAALCIRFDEVARNFDFSHASIMESGFQTSIWRLSTVWSVGPALHASALGLALVLVFLVRLVKGTSSLPLSLASASNVLPGQDQEWKRNLVFVFVAITCMSVIGSLAGVSLLGVYHLIAKFTSFRSLPPTDPLTAAISTACLAGVAAWAAGESRWRELRRFVAVPETQYGLLGVIFPIAIQLMPNLVLYVSDQVRWAAIYFGNFSRPGFASYFSFPDPLYFWYLIAACFEEIIWRGYLQPRFIRRYGLTRGIFLLGVVWSSFHFLGDFTKVTEDYQVLSVLISRLSFCIAMSYVLGWLTLRSGSIWPAALAHGLSNVWVLSSQSSPGVRQSALSTRIIIVICWGLLGILLFRFWPPSIGREVSDQVAGTRTERKL
jgi:membrane protease YdiL (CAAX protease family)